MRINTSQTDDRSLPVEEGALHQVQSGERRKTRDNWCQSLYWTVSVVLPGDTKLLQAVINGNPFFLAFTGGGGGGQWDNQLLHQLGQRTVDVLQGEAAKVDSQSRRHFFEDFFSLKAKAHRQPGQTTEEKGLVVNLGVAAASTVS